MHVEEHRHSNWSLLLQRLILKYVFGSKFIATIVTARYNAGLRTIDTYRSLVSTKIQISNNRTSPQLNDCLREPERVHPSIVAAFHEVTDSQGHFRDRRQRIRRVGTGRSLCRRISRCNSEIVDTRTNIMYQESAFSTDHLHQSRPGWVE